MYVANALHDRVQMFGLDGTFQRTWGYKDSGEGEFKTPSDVTLHGDQH